MPSDSVVGFLDRAKENRVLFPEQVEQLIRQPDIPQSDLTSLCEYLLNRGVVTRFQAAAIREGRGQELTYAGYPVIDEIGPCPGGMAYKALHPSLRTPLILRRISPRWLAPDDNAEAYLSRAKSFGMLIHANVVPLLDAGFQQDELYVVIDQPSDVVNLETLAREVGGAMPGFLAAEYGRVLSSAIRMVHERGGVHGEVWPGNLMVGPISVKKGPDGKERRRPAPNAIVRLMELGLVPIRPATTQYHPDPQMAAYLPPERLDSGVPGARGDIYGLGATLYFLLAGRPPFEGADLNDVLNRVRSAEPVSLQTLRPDLSVEFVELVASMLRKQPDRRPPTAADVMMALTAFCRAESVQPQTIPLASPASTAGSAPVASAESLEAAAANDAARTVEVDEAWGASAMTFSTVQSSAEPVPRKRTMSSNEKKRARMWLIIGAILHLTGTTLFLAWWFGAFDSTPPEPSKEQPPVKKENQPLPKKGKKQNFGA
jgi:serine/threonine protein kinase